LHSVLFQFGSISIFAYGLITAIGLLISTYYFIKLALKNKRHLEFISDHFFIFILSALVGARLAYAYAFWETYSWNFWSLFYFWESAYLFWGGVIAFLMVFAAYAFKQKENLDTWLDTIIPGLTLGLTFESIAQFLDGSSYGKPTELFLGVTFETTTVPYTIPIHPTQLYLAGVFTILLLVIYPWMRRKYNKQEGLVGWGGLALIALSSFIIEFFRGDEMELLFGLRWPQVLELIVFAVCGVFIYKIFIKEEEEEEQHGAE
jgi:phosphatidylglycerol---prolipoprotein diacylglyceryl transferase